MTDTHDTAYFKSLLLQKHEEIRSLEEIRNASTATVMLDQSSVGRLSRMDAMQQQAMAQSSRQRAELALRRIEAALRRCDDGSYGYCLDCAEPIDQRRLVFDPATTLCIACAQARET
jgi:DnaK suppressor protein